MLPLPSTRIKPAIFSHIFSKQNILVCQGYSTESMSPLQCLLFLQIPQYLFNRNGKTENDFQSWRTKLDIYRLHPFVLFPFPVKMCLHIFWPKNPLIKTWLTNHFHGNRLRCYMPENVSIMSSEQSKLFVSVRDANWRNLFFFPKGHWTETYVLSKM